MVMARVMIWTVKRNLRHGRAGVFDLLSDPDLDQLRSQHKEDQAHGERGQRQQAGAVVDQGRQRPLALGLQGEAEMESRPWLIPKATWLM